MAAAQKQWLLQLRRALSDTTQSTTAFGAISLQHPLPNVHLLLMLEHHSTLARISRSSPTASFFEGSHTMQLEYTLFLSDFAQLLGVLAQQLERVGCSLNLPKPPGSTPSGVVKHSAGAASASDVFSALWRLLVVGCSASSSALCYSGQAVFPTNQQRASPSLWDALYRTLTWLLTFSRSQAWTSMEARHGLPQRKSDLLTILKEPLNCLNFISTHPTPNPARQLRLLPPAFVPLVCCILTEQFCNVPPLVPRPPRVAGVAALSLTPPTPPTNIYYDIGNVLRILACFLFNCLNLTMQDEGCISELTFLRAPAIKQLFKGVLLLPSKTLRAAPTLVDESTQCLVFLIHLSQRMDTCLPPVRLSLGDNEQTNRDSLGLPLHLNPCLSAAALEADTWLLHALGSHMQRDASLARHGLMLQELTVNSWVAAANRSPPSLAVLGTMNSSVVGLAQQCTSQSLQLMVQLRRERRRQPTLWSFQQQRQAARQDAAGSAQHLQLRNLMTLTSQFHGQMLGGKPEFPTSGGNTSVECFCDKGFWLCVCLRCRRWKFITLADPCERVGATSLMMDCQGRVRQPGAQQWTCGASTLNEERCLKYRKVPMTGHTGGAARGSPNVGHERRTCKQPDSCRNHKTPHS